MPLLTFGEYRPDVSDLNGADSSVMSNALPRADGYGPFNAFEAFTAALPAQCRGYFFARNADGTVAIFAGTSTKLYKLDNTLFTWTDVSLGAGTYSSPDNNRNWRFAQFNNFVFATQRNAALQVYDLTSSSAFADLGGSPPRAGNIAIVNRFVVLCDLLDYPYRVQWSGLNATTTWTSGTNYSDYQDLPSGGTPKAIVGGELGIILQDTEVRRMTYAAGSDVIFQIEKIAERIGIIGSDSAVTANNAVYFYSSKGFISMSLDGGITPIGQERVDRTFGNAYDDTAPQYVIAAADPGSGMVLWSYRSDGSAQSYFDTLLGYNYYLNRWAPPIAMNGEYLASLAQPGLTLEALDAIAPGALVITGTASGTSSRVRITVSSTSGITTGDVKTISGVLGTTEANGTWSVNVIDGTHLDLVGTTYANAYVSGGIVAGSLDALPFSLDDISSATLPRLSMVDTNHKAGFFSGTALEATLATAESNLSAGYRVDVNGLIPVTDAATVYGSVGMRGNLNAAATYSTENLIDGDGLIPALVNTRYARGKIRIPAAETWTFATGLEPDFQKAGRY